MLDIKAKNLVHPNGESYCFEEIQADVEAANQKYEKGSFVFTADTVTMLLNKIIELENEPKTSEVELRDLIRNFEPVKYYRYAHAIRDVIATNKPYNRRNEYEEKNDPLLATWKIICEKAMKTIDYHFENKTVIELKGNMDGSDVTLYIGQWDARVSIGLSFIKP